MKTFSITVFLLIAFSSQALAENKKNQLPKDLQVALFYKVLGFNLNLKGDISIHVIGDNKMAAEFKQILFKKIGQARITKITASDSLPTDKPSVIYIGQVRNIRPILNYCRENKVISISDNAQAVLQGASLAVTAKQSHPQILLGLQGTKHEKIKWSSRIYKLANLIK